jgi:hypothetical protein
MARQLWGRQHIAEFTSCISPVRLRLPGSGAAVETHLLSTEFPGEFRLLMLVPCSGWPARPPSRTRLIRRRTSKPAGDPRPHP